MQKPQTAQERLIFALDVETEFKAHEYVNMLEGVVSFYKVGWELFLLTGLSFVRHLTKNNLKAFLDLKVTPDIPEQLKRTVAQYVSNGIEFLTVHGNGKTIQMIKEARGDNRTVKLLSLTALTTMDVHDMRDLYITDLHNSDFSFKFKSVEDFVKFRAEESLKAGCDGLIASGKHAKMLRENFGSEFILICPGIRPEGFSPDDHKRAATPTEAIQNGADYLVVGRPIRDADDPRDMAQRIIDEIAAADHAVVS